MMYGVSPAFFISRYGTDFGCKEMSESLPDIKKIGFDSWQPEIFLPKRLNEWEEGAWKALRDASHSLSLKSSSFMAHFLLNGFNSEEMLFSDGAVNECERLVTHLEKWKEIEVVSLPLPGYTGKIGHREMERLGEKLGKICQMIEQAGKVCAVELLPGALVAGSEGFLALLKVPSLKNLTVNLDTGHFNAMNEPSDQIIQRLGDYVSVTHLCDNDGITNNSYIPGWNPGWNPGENPPVGMVDWKPYEQWAARGTFKGSMDVEIVCDKDDVMESYRKGLQFLKNSFSR